MMARTLLTVGLLGFLGLATFTAVGLFVLKDRVRIVAHDDTVAERPDAAALLRDDVRSLDQDLQGLATAVGHDFERLAQAIESGAAERQRQLVQALDAVGSVPARLEAIEQRMQALEAKVAVIATPAADVAPPGSPPQPTATAVAPVAVPQSPVTASTQVQPEPQPHPDEVRDARNGEAREGAPPAAGEPSPARAAQPARRGSFLTFDLPTRSAKFGDPQEFTLLPELSRVGFDAVSTLHDFSGVTSKVAGGFRADLADAQGAWTGEIRCEAATLVTGVDGRDAGLREHLDTAHEPQITFRIDRFVPADRGIDAAKETVRGEIHGKMTIRGTARDMRMPVVLTFDASRRLCIEGQVPLLLSDYGVPVPSKLGVISMQDEVRVWVALRARGKALTSPTAPAGREAGHAGR